MLQSHYQITSTTTSAHLAQTMTLLSLTSEELIQRIETELSNNPALELIEERRCPMCKRVLPPHGPCPICSQPAMPDSNDPIIFISEREDFYNSSYSSQSELPEDAFSSETIDLPTFVLRQIAPDLDIADRPIAAYILTHIDEDGFLPISPIEIARYHHRLPSEIENIINKIKRCEPLGVCSSNPKEAMLIQVDVLSENKKIPQLTKEIISDHLDLLSHHQYNELAKFYSVNLQQIRTVEKFISENLNPFPSRSFWGDIYNPNEHENQVYHRPDVLIYHLNDRPENPLVVEIIVPIRGTLRINPMFKQTLKSVENEKIEDWKEDIEKANLLIKCIQQRNNALKLLLEKIVTRQKDFILNGEKELVSITRAEIAKELNVHESTISRAVSGKTAQLPNRRNIPLSMFFDRSLACRTIVKEVIESESEPLSDTEIQEILAEKGIIIARRTVAKYRSMEGILPAHLRQAKQLIMS